MPSTVERFETVTAVLAGVVTGGAVGIVGSVFHRFASGDFPTGVVAALSAVALGAVFMRALAGRGSYVAYTATLLAVIALGWFTADRIVADQPVGVAWTVGAVVLGVAGMLLPESWFQ